jgi:hypothetical protein
MTSWLQRRPAGLSANSYRNRALNIPLLSHQDGTERTSAYSHWFIVWNRATDGRMQASNCRAQGAPWVADSTTQHDRSSRVSDNVCKLGFDSFGSADETNDEKLAQCTDLRYPLLQGFLLAFAEVRNTLWAPLVRLSVGSFSSKDRAAIYQWPWTVWYHSHRMWRKERLWNFRVLRRVHLSNLICMQDIWRCMPLIMQFELI